MTDDRLIDCGSATLRITEFKTNPYDCVKAKPPACTLCHVNRGTTYVVCSVLSEGRDRQRLFKHEYCPSCKPKIQELIDITCNLLRTSI